MILGNGVFMNWYYAKHIGLDIADFWKSICSILPGMILPVGVGIAINRFWNLDSYGDILLAIALMTGVYCLSVWLFSMNDYEKQLVAQPVKRILRRNK
jgi:ABC-type maltose transport system permease subunit